jgi:hypothetical protein
VSRPNGFCSGPPKRRRAAVRSICPSSSEAYCSITNFVCKRRELPATTLVRNSSSYQSERPETLVPTRKNLSPSKLNRDVGLAREVLPCRRVDARDAGNSQSQKAVAARRKAS